MQLKFYYRTSYSIFLGSFLGALLIVILIFVLYNFFGHSYKKTGTLKSNQVFVSVIPTIASDQEITTTVFPYQGSEIRGWKVFTDTRFDYSITYPSHWSFFGNSEAVPDEKTDTTIYFYDTTRPPYLDRYEGITLSVGNNENGLPLEKWPEKLYREVTGGRRPADPLPMERLTIARHPALKVSNIPSRNTKYSVLISYGQKIIFASLALDAENENNNIARDYEDIFFHMLATLHLPEDK